MPSIPFTKMHGLGNDFIVIDGWSVPREKFLDQKKSLTPEFARRVCDRRYGIGADQILWIKPAQGHGPQGSKSKRAVAAMEVINADGSMAEMCGNGIRAVALYLDQAAGQSSKPARGSKAKSKSSKIYPIETGAGLLTVEVSGESVRVDMGTPKPASASKPFELEKLNLGSDVILFRSVSMGNPHAVIMVDDLASYPCESQGPAIEKLPRFPKRTNVEFVQVVQVMKPSSRSSSPSNLSSNLATRKSSARPSARSRIKIRVWERGAGFTLACGTGACAAAVAAIAAGDAQSPVEVELPGGKLVIEWSGDPRHSVFMSGPAEEVFRGVISC
jgi:diaminopimelate epimerase